MLPTNTLGGLLVNSRDTAQAGNASSGSLLHNCAVLCACQHSTTCPDGPAAPDVCAAPTLQDACQGVSLCLMIGRGLSSLLLLLFKLLHQRLQRGHLSLC